MNSLNKLQIFDLLLKKRVRPRGPGGLCCGEYYYSVTGAGDEIGQQIEDWLSSGEGAMATQFEGICDRIINNKKITESDKRLVSDFMAILLFRGPYMRTQLERMSESALRQINKIRYGTDDRIEPLRKIAKKKGIPLTPENEKILLEKITTRDRMRDKVTQLKMLVECQGFSNMMFGKDWLIYVISSDDEFITTDNPVYEEFPEWTGKFFYGPTFMQRTHYFALSPKILIVAREPRDYSLETAASRVRRKTLYGDESSKKMVGELNLKRVNATAKYAYSCSGQALDVFEIYIRSFTDAQNEFVRKIVRSVGLF